MQVPSTCLTSSVPPSDGPVTPRTRDLLTPARCESAAGGAAARQVSAGGLVSALQPDLALLHQGQDYNIQQKYVL